MSWLDLFFLAFFFDLGLAVIVITVHRCNQGTSPYWEAGAFTALVLWLITAIVRVGADVFGLPFAGGATAVQTFFWAGLAEIGLLWGLGQIQEFYRTWSLESQDQETKTP